VLSTVVVDFDQVKTKKNDSAAITESFLRYLVWIL